MHVVRSRSVLFSKYQVFKGVCYPHSPRTKPFSLGKHKTSVLLTSHPGLLQLRRALFPPALFSSPGRTLSVFFPVCNTAVPSLSCYRIVLGDMSSSLRELNDLQRMALGTDDNFTFVYSFNVLFQKRKVSDCHFNSPLRAQSSENPAIESMSLCYPCFSPILQQK